MPPKKSKKRTRDAPRNTRASPFKTSSNPFYGDVMRVTVTNEGETRNYQIHKNLLQQKSPYFMALPNFQEGADNHVILETINLSAFDNIVHWLYKDLLDPQYKDDRMVLIHTWAVADRLMMTRCKNETMDEMRKTFGKECSDIAGLRFLAAVETMGYTNDSPLERFITDLLVCDCLFQDIHENLSEINKWWRRDLEGMQTQTVIKLTLKLITRAQDYCKKRSDNVDSIEDPSQLQGCHYHEHSEGEECYLDTGE